MDRAKEIVAYLRENVRDYDVRLSLALSLMDRMRCSLRFATPELFDEIVENIEDWCDENDFSFDEILMDWDDIVEGDNGIIWED